jgi:hypothetical protein
MWVKSFVVVASRVVAAVVAYSGAFVAYSEAFVAHSDWASLVAGEGLDQAAPSFPAEEVELDVFVAT